MIGTASASAWLAGNGARLLLWGAAALFLVGLGFAGGLKYREAQVANLKLAHAQATAKPERESTRLANEYRQREHEMGDQFLAASARHIETLRRVQADNDSLRADLRSGAQRLHDRWACPSVAATVPGPAGPRLDPDAAARGREESAGRAIAAADYCDAQVIGLQRLLLAERQGQGAP